MNTQERDIAKIIRAIRNDIRDLQASETDDAALSIPRSATDTTLVNGQVSQAVRTGNDRFLVYGSSDPPETFEYP